MKKLPSRTAVLLLSVYKRVVSPLLPPSCRFDPTCSVYARECFERHPFGRALLLSMARLGRCHPFHAGGYDPVPPAASPEHQEL